jgi:branched-chain amino acid transport system ATP-binding protein
VTVVVPHADENGSALRSSVLQVKDASVSYGGVQALSQVSLEASSGMCLAIIGPNGAGKTTLFDAIAGVTSLKSGAIILDGEDVSDEPVLYRARHGIGRTYQRQQVFGGLTVEDNILVSLDWHGGGGGVVADMLALPSRRRRERDRRARVAEMMELCGLTADRYRPGHSLTIGKARMLEIARALVDTPKVLLLDEPTSGMEPVERERLSQIVRHVRLERNAAVLLIEHDVTFVMEHADRVVVLHLGYMLAEGTPAEIQSNPEVREAYLG